jgi:hypothetical protein
MMDEARQAVRVAMQLRQYRDCLRATRLSPARERALLEMLQTCRREGIGVVLYVGPEHSRWRAATAAEQSARLEGLLEMARREYGAATCDARAWLPDEAFHDAHHPHDAGAAALSDRFAAEVLGVRGASSPRSSPYLNPPPPEASGTARRRIR